VVKVYLGELRKLLALSFQDFSLGWNPETDRQFFETLIVGKRFRGIEVVFLQSIT